MNLTKSEIAPPTVFSGNPPLLLLCSWLFPIWFKGRLGGALLECWVQISRSLPGIGFFPCCGYLSQYPGCLFFPPTCLSQHILQPLNDMVCSVTPWPCRGRCQGEWFSVRKRQKSMSLDKIAALSSSNLSSRLCSFTMRQALCGDFTLTSFLLYSSSEVSFLLHVPMRKQSLGG